MTTHRITPTGVPLTTVQPDDTADDVADAQGDVLAAMYGTPYVVPGEPIADPRPAAGEDEPIVSSFANATRAAAAVPSFTGLYDISAPYVFGGHGPSDLTGSTVDAIRAELDTAFDALANALDDTPPTTPTEPDPEPFINPAAGLLDEARMTVNQRDQIHGKERLLAPIADLWSAYHNTDITPWDVANMMALLKIARIKRNPKHRDSHVDLAGYAALGYEAAEAMA